MNFGPLGLHLKNLKFHVVEDASSHMSEVSPWRVLVYSPEGRQVSLEDGGVRIRENATVRAVLGRVELRTPSTDVTEQRPPSSLVLFDSAGKVVRAIP